MTDIVDIPTGAQPSLRLRARKFVFWTAVAGAGVAAMVAGLSPGAGGLAGLTLLGGMCAAGLVMLYAFAERETGALWPFAKTASTLGMDRDMMSAASAFDAIRDPAVIVGANGAPRAANRAYRELARSAGVLDESPRTPGLERVLGVHPAISEAIFRLSKAARRGERRRERLPAAPIGPSGRSHAFDLEVA
ncbi:MAG: hypothetical protein MI723_01910, partial [Caulobacterales bacterium]|nr:hypothetical protein [Caulobacterales bacterium]